MTEPLNPDESKRVYSGEVILRPTGRSTEPAPEPADRLQRATELLEEVMLRISQFKPPCPFGCIMLQAGPYWLHAPGCVLHEITAFLGENPQQANTKPGG